MTGRKGRMVSVSSSTLKVKYESRSEPNVPLNTVNIKEKEVSPECFALKLEVFFLCLCTESLHDS